MTRHKERNKMGFRQPRVPQMREGAPLTQFVRELALFLKEFCLESWTQSKRHGEEIENIKKQLRDGT
jgi:hypothetical protein